MKNVDIIKGCPEVLEAGEEEEEMTILVVTHDSVVAQKANEENTGVEIFCGFFEENNTVFYNSPIILSKELPEGMDFSGNVTLLLPIQEIESIRELIGEFCQVRMVLYETSEFFTEH